jgi:hypothetical protein
MVYVDEFSVYVRVIPQGCPNNTYQKLNSRSLLQKFTYYVVILTFLSLGGEACLTSTAFLCTSNEFLSIIMGFD